MRHCHLVTKITIGQVASVEILSTTTSNSENDL